MPYDYKIDKHRRLVMSTASGVFTPADALAHAEKLLKDPDFDPSFSQFIDLVQVTAWEIDPAELRSLAQVNVFSPHSRRAILAPTDLTFGFGRMFEMLRDFAGETGIRVFRIRDDAMAWVLPNHSAP
jgi:hypothetical protein